MPPNKNEDIEIDYFKNEFRTYSRFSLINLILTPLFDYKLLMYRFGASGNFTEFTVFFGSIFLIYGLWKIYDKNPNENIPKYLKLGVLYNIVTITYYFF